jgi:hypothetical protein
VVAAAALALLAAGHESGRAARLASAGCKRNYDYTGVQNAAPSSGIRAYLTTTTTPEVNAGHVAGWVGVGGPGLGPNGTDEWLQTGYSGFDTGEAQVYYEVALPNKPPAYHTVVATLAPSAKNLVTVLEVAGRQGSWQVFMNNKPVSPVISLPKSHGKVDTECVRQSQSARFQTDTLYLSSNTCAVLLGYAIAQPRAPKPGTATGLQVAETALGVLRAIAGASGGAPARVDCRAVGLFYRALRGLGATSGEALALRSSLLQAGPQLSPPLSLPPSCPIH